MNKIYFVIIIFSGLTNQLISQQYAKIPIDSNYYWLQLSTCGYRYQIKYSKDTLISNKTYNKYSQFSGSIGTTPCLQTFIKHGFLRQDTINKKVFILDNNFIERPLYDFNKTVGDTMLIYDKMSNTNITYTVTFDYGTVLEINNGGTPRHIQEGEGCWKEGLYGPNAANDTITEKLVCFGKINPFTQIVGPEVGFEGICHLITGLKNNLTTDFSGIKIFPNPVSDKLYIENLSFNYPGTALVVFNNLGQSISQLNDSVPKQEIDLSFLPAGIYYLKAQSNSAQEVFKIIKE